MLNIIFSLLIFLKIGSHVVASVNLLTMHKNTLSEHTISLNNRYNNEFVNNVFKDNILLDLNYMETGAISGGEVDWKKIEKPFKFSLKLMPGQIFAFHDDVLPKYQGKVNKTTNSHFNWDEGFRSDGYLVGDGVCHLASLLYWTAKDAGLETEAPTNHNFANIPEVPKQFGVAIYYYPGQNSANEMQNLYVKNNKDKTISFNFDYDGNNLKSSISEDN